MPVTKSASKALRASLRRQVINTQVRSRMKTAIKSFLGEPNTTNLSSAFSAIDRAVKKNLINRNTAARRKSRLSHKVSAPTTK